METHLDFPEVLPVPYQGKLGEQTFVLIHNCKNFVYCSDVVVVHIVVMTDFPLYPSLFCIVQNFGFRL